MGREGWSECTLEAEGAPHVLLSTAGYSPKAIIKTCCLVLSGKGIQESASEGHVELFYFRSWTISRNTEYDFLVLPFCEHP